MNNAMLTAEWPAPPNVVAGTTLRSGGEADLPATPLHPRSGSASNTAPATQLHPRQRICQQPSAGNTATSAQRMCQQHRYIRAADVPTTLRHEPSSERNVFEVVVVAAGLLATTVGDFAGLDLRRASSGATPGATPSVAARVLVLISAPLPVSTLVTFATLLATAATAGVDELEVLDHDA